MTESLETAGSVSEEEGARRTEGRKEGRADAGGMAANKTRTPHRDVEKKASWNEHRKC